MTLELVLLSVAVYRITRLVVTDAILDGPRDRVTSWAWATDPVFPYQMDRRKEWVGDLISCHWCTSVWVAAAVTAAAWPFLPGLQWPLLVWAFTAAAGALLHQVDDLARAATDRMAPTEE